MPLIAMVLGSRSRFSVLGSSRERPRFTYREVLGKFSVYILFMFWSLARDITGISRISRASLGKQCSVVITAALHHTRAYFVQ